jgi:hypothetical protein
MNNPTGLPICIFTFVTNRALYEDMVQSFVDAGFGSEKAIFIELRDDKAEPYSMLTHLIETHDDPFFVMCHQDVRLDQGHGYEELLGTITALDEIDPLWAVAGNAGGRRNLQLARTLTDPWGGRSSDKFPARVHTLDENFLIVRTRTGFGCSTGLNGFHLYGPDLCLNAIAAGRTVYVVDFRLRHLSKGNRESNEYKECVARYIEHWRGRYVIRYLRASTDLLFLSRFSFLQRALGHPRPRAIIKKRAWLARPVGWFFSHRY